MTSIIERLKQLETAATPRPWAVGNYDGQSMIHGPERTKPVVKAVGSAEFEIISDEFGQVITPDAVMPIEHRPNAHLITEMRNALPALLRVVEATKKMDDYRFTNQWGSPCDSDLQAIRKALAALELTPSHSQPEAAHSQLSKEEK